jgi:hypothetical protein
MPAQNIIDALGISWKLDTSSDYATLTYAHPVLGLLQYTGDVPWIADNVNTLKLTSRGDLPAVGDVSYVKVLPDSVCIRPLYDANGCGCYDLVTYDSVANQCACKDPGCDCIPEFMCLTCDGDKECCTGDACVGGRDGVDNPSGPSRELCCTLLGVLVCGVWYCSGGQWKVDIYCDGVLITTNDISHEGCPLVLGSTSFSGCVDCEGCVGEDCDPDPPPGIDTPCCDEPTPETLTASISYSGGCACPATSTLTFNAALVRWDGTFPGCSTPFRLECVGVTWQLTTSGGTFNAVTVVCSPISITFTGVTFVDCPLQTATVIITA